MKPGFFAFRHVLMVVSTAVWQAEAQTSLVFSETMAASPANP
jgi:hypothetical protein